MIINIIDAIKASVLTTRGDIVYRNATVPARLAKGTAGQVLTMGADDPEWAASGSGLAAATQAEMETATSVAVASTPGRQHFHPGHPKCWAYVTVSAGTPTLQTNYNITSITDTATGLLTVTIATDFSDANWACLASVALADITIDNVNDERQVTYESIAAGSVVLHCINRATATTGQDPGGDDADPASWSMSGLGDQA